MMMSHFDLPLRNRKDLARAAQLRSLAFARPMLPSTAYEANTFPPLNRRGMKNSRNAVPNDLNSTNTNNPYYLNPLLDHYLASDTTQQPTNSNNNNNNNNNYPSEIHLLNNLTQGKNYYHSAPNPSSYHYNNNTNTNNHNNHTSSFSSTSSASSSSYPRRSTNHSIIPQISSPPPRPSFQKASRALSAALQNAHRQAEHLESSFASDTRDLYYADDRTRALLWRAKVGFCGWRNQDEGDNDEEGDEFGRGEGRGKRRVGDENLFAVCAGRLLDAIEDMRYAGRVWGRGEGGAGRASFGLQGGGNGNGGEYGAGGGSGNGTGLGVEDVRLAMKKLGVSFGALAELLEGVRVEKARCPVLVRELRSAQDVLQGIRRVWESPSRNGGNGGRRRDGFSGGLPTTGGAKIPVAAFVEDWENSSYRGE